MIAWIFGILFGCQSVLSQTTVSILTISNTSTNGNSEAESHLVDGTNIGEIDDDPRKVNTDSEAEAFLMTYGYFPEEADNVTVRSLPSSIQQFIGNEAAVQFQEFVGLPKTGEFDAATLEYMNKPRCGKADIDPGDKYDKRRRRYALRGDGREWTKKIVSYKMYTYSNKLPRGYQDDTIKKVLRLWSDASTVKFAKTNDDNDVDMKISFEKGEHGDPNPFDGPGGVGGHAYYPGGNDAEAGDTHLDEDENWLVDSLHGMDMEYIALHELGHALGLGHSTQRVAIMFPYIRPYDPNIVLNADDIQGIQAIYGEPANDMAITECDRTVIATNNQKTLTSPRHPNNYPGNSHCDWTVKVNEGQQSDSRIIVISIILCELQVTDSCNLDYIEIEQDTAAQKLCKTSHQGIYEYKTTSTLYIRFRSDETTSNRGFRLHYRTGNRLETSAPPPTAVASNGVLCQGKMNAITIDSEYNVFVFIGHEVYKIGTDDFVVTGYPRQLSQEYSGFPSGTTVDAASYINSILLLFSGEHIYTVNSNNMVIGQRPTPLTQIGFGSTVKKINAVAQFHSIKKLYVFTDTHFYRLTTQLVIDPGYPVANRRWRGLGTDPISGAMEWKNSQLYFFRGNQYYRWNSRAGKVDSNYPRSTAPDWFRNCQS